MLDTRTVCRARIEQQETGDRRQGTGDRRQETGREAGGSGRRDAGSIDARHPVCTAEARGDVRTGDRGRGGRQEARYPP